MMNEQNKLDFCEIENILIHKQFKDLLLAEKELLQKHIGNQEQIVAYQQFLRQTQQVLNPIQAPEIKARPSIQQQLRQRLQAQKLGKNNSIQKNSLEQFCLSILSIFTLRPPLHTGLAMAILVLAFWCGNHFNQYTANQGNLVSDSIAFHIADTASVFLPADDSDSNKIKRPILPKDTAKSSTDSFNINAILRR